MLEVGKKLFLLGLGAINLTEKKLKKVMEDLERRGEVTKEEAGGLIKEFLQKAEESKEAVKRMIDNALKSAVEKMNLPTRDEIEQLKRKITQLSKKIDQLKK